jgi:hypothetical protein
MPFFKSFWRETGKNTGKWASNKVFGDGWSTPFRTRISRDVPSVEDIEATVSRRQTPRGGMSKRVSDPDYLFDKADEVEFNSQEVNDITNKLDELQLGAHKAIEDGTSVQIFRTKIRSGIQRLKRLGEIDTARFYESEYSKISRGVMMGRLFIVFIFVALIVMAAGGFEVYALIWKALF